MSRRRLAREEKYVSESRRKKIEAIAKIMAKIGRILGFGGALALFVYGLYWLTIPGGWIVAIGMFIAGAIVAFESYRVFRVR